MWHTQFLPPTLWATLPMPPMLNLPTWHTTHTAMVLLVLWPQPTLPMWHIQYQVPMLWAQWPMPPTLSLLEQLPLPTLPTQPTLLILLMLHTQLLVPMSQATWPMPPMLNLLTWHTMHMAMGSLVQSAVLIRLILPMWHIQCQVPMLWAQWPTLPTLFQQDQPTLPTLPTLPMWLTQLLVPMS